MSTAINLFRQNPLVRVPSCLISAAYVFVPHRRLLKNLGPSRILVLVVDDKFSVESEYVHPIDQNH